MNPDHLCYYWPDSVPSKTEGTLSLKEIAVTSFKQKISNVDVDKNVLGVMSEVILAFNQLVLDSNYDQCVIKECRAYVENKFSLNFKHFF